MDSKQIRTKWNNQPLVASETKESANSANVDGTKKENVVD